jgi:Zn-dependent peptidase ImmA (M78 family)
MCCGFYLYWRLGIGLKFKQLSRNRLSKKLMKNPISKLNNNIIHAFENVNSTSLDLIKKSVSDANTSGVISIEVDYQKTRTPKGGLETRNIILHETYLSHLWSYIYSMFVIFEEGYQKPLTKHTFSGEINYDSELLIRAKKLYDWSIGLTTKYRDWDLKLPNPMTNGNNDLENDYILKTNNIYQNAVAFLLYHEFSHLTQGHDNFNFNHKVSAVDYIVLENEADQFAYNMLINQHMDIHEKTLMSMSIILVLTSSLFLTNSKFGISQPYHPDLDSRIINFLQNLNYKKNSKNEFYFYSFSSIAMILFFVKYDILYTEETEFESVHEQFEYLLKIMDKLK